MGSLVTIFGEEKCLEFEKQSGGEVGSRAEAVPDAKTEESEREKATGLAVENLRVKYVYELPRVW